VEETELNYPVRITRYSLIPDSEGPGRFRGGLGLCREYSFVDHEAVFTILADRAKFPPWGLFGGDSGRTARYLLIKNGSEQEIGSKVTLYLSKNDVIRMETCGGGGFGPAWERDPRKVLRDVRERKVSIDRARQCYRVVVQPDLSGIDETVTEQLRQESRRDAAPHE